MIHSSITILLLDLAVGDAGPSPHLILNQILPYFANAFNPFCANVCAFVSHFLKNQAASFGKGAPYACVFHQMVL